MSKDEKNSDTLNKSIADNKDSSIQHTFNSGQILNDEKLVEALYSRVGHHKVVEEQVDPMKVFEHACAELLERNYDAALATLRNIPPAEQDPIVKAAIAACYLKNMNILAPNSSWLNYFQSFFTKKRIVDQDLLRIKHAFFIDVEPYKASFSSRAKYSDFLRKKRYHKIQIQFGFISESIAHTTRKAYKFAYSFAPLVGITLGTCHGLFRAMTRDALGILEQNECIRRLELVNEFEKNPALQKSRLDDERYWSANIKPPPPAAQPIPLLSKQALIEKIFVRYKKYHLALTASAASKTLFNNLSPTSELNPDEKWKQVGEYMREPRNNGKKLYLIIYEILKNEKRLDLPESLRKLLHWRP